MTNPYPLIIVMGTIVVLVIVQRMLSRIENSGGQIHPAPSTPAQSPASPAEQAVPKKSRRNILMPGLSVSGPDEKSIDRIRSLIKKKDMGELAMVLAGLRPNIAELDDYLEKLRTRFLASVPENADIKDPETIQELLANFTPPTPPAGLSLDSLTAHEQLILMTFNPRSQRLVTHDFMSIFGGQAFSERFTFYCKHKKSHAMLIKESSPDRQIMEALAQTEMADKGRHIPLALRLTVLSMDQLRQMCKDLNREIKFASKQELTEELSQIPGSAVLLSMQCSVDDLFILNPLKVDQKDAEKEWRYLLAYAKFLTTSNPLAAS